MAYVWKVLAVGLAVGWYWYCNSGSGFKPGKGYPDRSNMRKVW